jgi:Flp pilus assembly protein TadD
MPVQHQNVTMIPARTGATALFIEANHRMSTGDMPGAEACLRQALQIVPKFAEAHANLGLVLDKRGAFDEAEFCYRESLALDSGHSNTYLNLGALLANQKRFDEAEAAYRLAIALSPRSAMPWSNLGALYACMKREGEAEQCYRTATDLDEGYDTARFNLSYLLLRQGRFEEGWRCLESRDWYAALAAHLSCPRWQGESLAGKSLLVGCEAGHGDMIQFCRYAATLKAHGASRITMICHPPLKRLLLSLAGVDKVIALDEPIPSAGWDFWTPALSMPYHCKTRIDTIPAAIPYLRAHPDQVAKWRSMLPVDGIRVGLVWKGNPGFENDADRSIPRLDLLLPLAAAANVHFVSLQKGAGEAEAREPPAGLPLTHLGSGIEDFADTAAVVANLDLVLCVDTAIAHLAGALGKPVWVLLPYYKTDWRWLTGRTDSPWYPGVMRLFRQPKMGDWTTVIAEVCVALDQFVRSRHTPIAEATVPLQRQIFA